MTFYVQHNKSGFGKKEKGQETKQKMDNVQALSSKECNLLLLFVGSLFGAVLAEISKNVHEEIVSPSIKFCLAKCGLNCSDEACKRRTKWQRVGFQLLELVIVVVLLYLVTRWLTRKPKEKKQQV